MSIAVDQVAERKGLRDRVRAANAETLVALSASRGPNRLWKIDTSHPHGLSARPAEYERRVVGFFDRTLSGD